MQSRNAGAMKRFTQIETSIIELANDDLLDLDVPPVF